MAFLNGVGVRGVVLSSDLWLGVTNLKKKKTLVTLICGWNMQSKPITRFHCVHWVLLLGEGGLVSLQRCGHYDLLTAHWRGREGGILQVMRVLLRPQVQELKQQTGKSAAGLRTVWVTLCNMATRQDGVTRHSVRESAGDRTIWTSVVSSHGNNPFNTDIN